MENGRRLKVALVFDDSLDSQDGVAQHVKTLGAWLSRQGHSVSYLVGETKLKNWHGGEVFSLAINQSVTFNGNRMSIPLPARSAKINAVLKQGQFDLIHVMMPYSPFLAQRIVVRAPKSTAVVGTFHIYPSGRLARTGAKILRIMCRPSIGRFSQIVSVSPAAADFARTAFGLESEVIPNPVDVSSYAKAADGTKQHANQIVFLGRLVKRKGSRQLIEAFAELKKRNSAAKLTIAGDGPLRAALESRVKQLGLNDSVDFAGFVDERSKPSVLAGAAVACFPSLFGESFGIVLVEAMAAGSGVVLGGDNPGYRSVFDGNSWSLVDPNDTAGFADKLYFALTDEKKRKDVHDWQNRQVKKFDIETIGPQVEKVYDLAIAHTTKTGHNMNHE